MRENNQVPKPAQYVASGELHVHSVFPTIQGEGPFCGERALFIRLWGCNLRCPGCDTEYTAKREYVTADFMVNEAKRHKWARGALVVITGGEPFRQNIVPSIMNLLREGYKVQIETNGVLWLDGLDDLIYRKGGYDQFQIVCSPKTSRIHERVLACAAAFKYVVQADKVDPSDGLPTIALGHPAKGGVARPRPGALTYIQPMDEGDPAANALNLDAAIRSTMQFGHRLQIQVHKHINME